VNYGFYQSAAGLISQVNRLQVASNNLANAQTTGFKMDQVVTAQRLPARIGSGLAADPHLLLEALGGGQMADPTRYILAQGGLRPSGGQLDLAIEGDGFFLVGDETGSDTRLTRDGRFTRDPDGELAMLGTGLKVLSDRHRPIPVPLGTLTIGPDGSVSQGETQLGRIGLVDVPNPAALRKLGNSLIATGAASGSPQPSEGSTLWHGFLESSTVEPVLEMTGLVRISRAVEANANLMKAQDQMMGQTINTFGKVT
jgi:flagellar basal body rod protein FlgG